MLNVPKIKLQFFSSLHFGAYVLAKKVLYNNNNYMEVMAEKKNHHIPSNMLNKKIMKMH